MNDRGAGLLDQSQALDYWEARHRTQDDLSSGGDIGLSRAENEAFYAQRLGTLIEVIGVGEDEARPLLLDAGCGRGFFARSLARVGYQVIGVDASDAAIERARSIGGRPDYVRSTLSDLWLDELFDVVVVVDVLFHITDDAEFERSLRRLLAHLGASGRLVIADRNHSESEVLGDYIHHRPVSRYLEVLGDGVMHRRFAPYRWPGNPIGFHVYEREGM